MNYFILWRELFLGILGIHLLYRHEHIGGRRFGRFIAIATRRESPLFCTLHLQIEMSRSLRGFR